MPESAFERRLREHREAATKAAPPVMPKWDADLIPEDPYDRSPQDVELDEAIKRIDIIDAYNKWCGKMRPSVGSSQREGIKISCPKPDHRDNNPSAWINLDKQTWFCGGCEEGGDAYDIAAYALGYPVPGYKEGSAFHNLRRDMAQAFGYRFVSAPGLKTPMLVAPTVAIPPPPSVVEAAKPSETVRPLSLVLPTVGDEEVEEVIEFPTLDWKSIVLPDTFLDVYMKLTTVDDIPDEYNFWNALVAIGLAIGNDVTLFDRVPVKGNLFICMLGNTGDGKSRSFSHLHRLIGMALPYSHDDITNKGSRIISGAASGEVLIHSFSKPIEDPANPKRIIGYAPVRGVIEFSELSALTGRSERMGNVLKPILMQFYDSQYLISTTSMSGGVKEAHQAFASAFTTTQPRALRKLVTQGDVDSGFLNRWVFASGGGKDRVAIGGATIEMDTAVDPLEDIVRWAAFGKQLQWSDKGASRFTEFFHKTIQPDKLKDESGLLTRMDLLVKKLILLFAVNAREEIVSLDSVSRAIAMYEYLIATYLIPAKAIGDTQSEACRRDILEVIRTREEKGKSPSPAEIVRALTPKKYPAELIEKTLKVLANLDIIEALPTPDNARGRRTVRYKLA